MAQAKASGKGAAKGKDGKPGVAAAATVENMPEVCPLGDDCHDAYCWRNRIHNDSAFSNEGPLHTHTEYYSPQALGNEAYDN